MYGGYPRGGMSNLTRRACYKCGNVGHYAGKQRIARASNWTTHVNRGLLLIRTSLLQLYVDSPPARPVLTAPTGKQPGTRDRDSHSRI
jgi:Zinc knuckle